MDMPIKPMLCRLAAEPFDDPAWSWEQKFDGDRILATIAPDKTILKARSGADKTAQFPEFNQLVYDQQATAIIDCELVSATGLSFSEFNQRRMNRQNDIAKFAREMPAKLMAFDVLSICGEDLSQHSFSVRRSMLENMHLEKLNCGRVEIIAQYTNGVSLFEKAKKEKWEGIIGKRLAGPYEFGKRRWLKVKVPRDGVFMVVGYTPGAGRRSSTFGALVLADTPDGDAIGNVGTGFNDAELKLLYSFMFARRNLNITCLTNGYVSVSPFRVKIRYCERTNAGKLRFPAYRGRAE